MKKSTKIAIGVTAGIGVGYIGVKMFKSKKTNGHVKFWEKENVGSRKEQTNEENKNESVKEDQETTTDSENVEDEKETKTTSDKKPDIRNGYTRAVVIDKEKLNHLEQVIKQMDNKDVDKLFKDRKKVFNEQVTGKETREEKIEYVLEAETWEKREKVVQDKK